MTGEDLTPIRQQYLEIKREYPNTVLFFRLGDFYETFDEDAEITSRELDIVLTSRPIGKGVRAPLAGIPYHAVETYLARLIEKGYHVAICEQIGDQPIKGIFPRKVVRVITPGTITDPGLLPGDSNNYLASIFMEGGQSAIAYTDITTGEFAVTQLPSESLRAEIQRLHPAEIIHPDNQTLDASWGSHFTPWTAWRFDLGKCEEELRAHFKTSTLEGFGLKDKGLAIRAAGALLQYLAMTQPDSLSLLTSLRAYNLTEYMTLDASARRNLELDETLRGERKGSLLGILDQTVTPMGRRLIHQWVNQPLLDPTKINARLDGIEFFVGHGLERAQLRSLLKPLADLERLTNRILTGQALPRELMGLRDTLDRIQAILELLERVMENEAKLPKSFPFPQACLPELKLLKESIADDPPSTLQNTGIIRPGYSEELDSVAKTSQHARDWIANLESTEQKRTGIKTLKVGYNKVFGYFIEISRGAAQRAPDNYIRKQTLVNAERYITPEMKEYETLVLNAEENIREIEIRLFREVCKLLSKSAAALLATASAIAELDVLSTLAETAVSGGFTRPELNEGTALEIRSGRHPVVERSLEGDRYVPNDVIFEQGEIVRIITGPNMSGKCVSGETLIATEDGLVTIASLMPAGTMPFEFSRLDLRIPGRNTMVEASHFFNGGSQNTIHICTRFGFGIEGTPEHLIWVRNQDGSEEWKSLAELQLGDLVMIVPGRNVWGSQTRIDVKRAGQDRGHSSIRFPASLNCDLAYSVGLLMGRDAIPNRREVVFSARDPLVADRFCAIISKQFGSTVPERPNRQDVVVESEEVRFFFGQLGVDNAPGAQKKVPASILRAPREIVIAFLQGLTDSAASADWSMGLVSIASASRPFAAQVQLILLNLGILAPIQSQNTDALRIYEVVIPSGIAVLSVPPGRLRCPYDLALGASRRDLTGMRDGDDQAGNLNGLKSVVNLYESEQTAPQARIGSVKIDGYGKVAPAYTPPGNSFAQAGGSARAFQDAYANQVIYDTVQSIEAGKTQVYDLSVPDGHAFIANGFLSHNSTYLRQTALIVLMAQMGSFVPAESAKIGLVDRIFTRIGAQDEIHAGQSTFMVEMIEAANILHHATPRSLLILDEIGRGTSTYDGLAIAWAMIEYIHNHPDLRAKTLFATHYHELTQLADLLPGIRNYNVAVAEEGGRVVFLHKIVPGGADKSYGIHVAQLAGLPPPVVQRANEIMAELEKSSGRAVQTNPHSAQQAALFPETSPLLDELGSLDVNSLSPIEALNKLFEWHKKYLKK
jgi:DNA mismatch repair protein MutS